ncbi:MAG: hypothetical protein KAY32_09775 [Candidatus Eisenbacteria sp.]|nr:hypothetical protein [Candidatus Eisenbacteria bacterium]
MATQVCNCLQGDASVQNVAVMPFTTLEGFETTLGMYLAEKLYASLFSCGTTFGLVDRHNLQRAFDEITMGSAGLVDLDAMLKVGKIVSADAIIVGTVTDVGEVLDVNARLVQTETSNVLAVSSQILPKDDAITALLRQGRRAVPGTSAPRLSKSGVPIVEDAPEDVAVLLSNMAFASAMSQEASGRLELEKIYSLIPEGIPSHLDKRYLVFKDLEREDEVYCLTRRGEVIVVSVDEVRDLGDVEALFRYHRAVNQLIQKVHPTYRMTNQRIYCSEGAGVYRRILAVRETVWFTAKAIEWQLRVPFVKVRDAELSLYSDNHNIESVDYYLGSRKITVPDKKHMRIAVGQDLSPGTSVRLSTNGVRVWYLQGSLRLVTDPSDERFMLGGEGEIEHSSGLEDLRLPWE